jgi:cardiolipin synthase
MQHQENTTSLLPRGAYRDFTLLVDGKRAFPEIIRCIESARRSVVINMFIWRDDEIGNRMGRAILQAAENGAEVLVSVDRYGVVLEKSEECKKSFFHKKQTPIERIKTRALEIAYPMKGAPRRAADEESELYRQILAHPRIKISESVFKADHSKYYVIDDEILFVGGINVEDKENGADMQGRVYGDYMAKLSGAAHVAAFYNKLTTGEDTAADYRFRVNLKDGSGKKLRFEMEDYYFDLIESARDSLHLTMAYFSPVRRITDALLRAHERGVRVSLLLPSHANYQDASNRRTLRYLLKKSKGGTVRLTTSLCTVLAISAVFSVCSCVSGA